MLVGEQKHLIIIYRFVGGVERYISGFLLVMSMVMKGVIIVLVLVIIVIVGEAYVGFGFAYIPQ